MGRRGPPPKPVALRVLHGNPGKRPLNGKPQPPVEAPRCPKALNPEARKVWKRIVPQLKMMGVLASVDRDALVAYCRTYARWKAAEDFLEKHGEVYPIRDEGGKVKCMMQFPQVAIARNLLQTLRAYQQEFGLTPSARSRIDITPPRPQSSGKVITDKYGRPC